MKLHLTTIYVCLVILFYGSILNAQNKANFITQLKYPSTPKIEVQDTLWGTIYKDNYRWLENMKDPKVISWFKQQSELSNSVMNTITGRDELIAEWKSLDNSQPTGYYPPIEANDRFFIQKINPGDDVSKVYYREKIDGKDILLFDPITFRPINLY